MARRIILSIHISLNGVVTGNPDGDIEDFAGEWTREGNLLGEASENLVRLFDRVDTILLGHGTYDALASRWPGMQGPPGADDVVSRLAAKVNGTQKLVVTRDTRLTDLPWGRFEAARPLVADDVAARIRELKAGNGGDVVIFGSPELARALIDADLIDEYNLIIHPVIVETGDRVFDGISTRTDLNLESVTALDEGGILAAYSRRTQHR